MAEAQQYPNEPTQAMDVREVVGVFATAEALDETVEELLSSGFTVPDISLLASEDAVERKLGHRLIDTRAAEDDPHVPRRPWTSPEARVEGMGAAAGVLGYVGAVVTGAVTLATGGTALAAVALGVLAGGASAIAGTRLAGAVDKNLADSLRQQIAHGGILLWVKVCDDAETGLALDILGRHGGSDIHVHRIMLG